MARSAGIVAVILGVALAVAPSAAANILQVTRADDRAPNGCGPTDCSLREAVNRANHTLGPDVVKLKAKTYELTIEGDGESTLAGDLDVLNDVSIVGAGPSRTAIKGAWAVDPDRLLQVTDAGTKLSMSGLTLRDGDIGTVERGGAVAVDAGAALSLSRARVTANRAQVTGGIDNSGKATINRVVFRNNVTSDCCGAFYNEFDSRATLTNVTFDHNTAVEDTGAMYSKGIRATLKNVTFSGNRAGDCCGGAMISSGGLLNITNATFSGNRTKGDGGALSTESGSTTNLNNVTFTHNVADSDGIGGGDGGGISHGGGTLNVQNTIIAGNTDTGHEANDCTGFTSHGHNLIGSITGCPFAVMPGDIFPVANPRLGSLAHNGGFTETVALKKNSKAINHGSRHSPGSGGSACPKRDQRGVKRPQGPRCDIGAYERRRKRPH
jgi:predicted outer membrane repeat protein